MTPYKKMALNRALYFFALPQNIFKTTIEFNDNTDHVRPAVTITFETNEALDQWVNAYQVLEDKQYMYRQTISVCHFPPQKQTTGFISCNACRCCSFSTEAQAYICHNEKNIKFGQIVSTKYWRCSGFTPYRWKEMSLDEALKIVTIGNFIFIPVYQLPNNSIQFATMTIRFKTNEDLDEWRDARVRIAIRLLA